MPVSVRLRPLRRDLCTYTGIFLKYPETGTCLKLNLASLRTLTITGVAVEYGDMCNRKAQGNLVESAGRTGEIMLQTQSVNIRKTLIYDMVTINCSLLMLNYILAMYIYVRAIGIDLKASTMGLYPMEFGFERRHEGRIVNK